MSDPKTGSRKTRSLESLLRKVDKKLDSPVFNGGFDALYQKVKNIEDNVEKLNSAIFDPEKGLLLRVHAEKVETDQDFKGLELKLENHTNKIRELDDQLKIYRKFVIGAALSVITAVFKLVWDLSHHISIN